MTYFCTWVDVSPKFSWFSFFLIKKYVLFVKPLVCCFYFVPEFFIEICILVFYCFGFSTLFSFFMLISFPFSMNNITHFLWVMFCSYLYFCWNIGVYRVVNHKLERILVVVCTGLWPQKYCMKRAKLEIQIIRDRQIVIPIVVDNMSNLRVPFWHRVLFK